MAPSTIHSPASARRSASVTPASTADSRSAAGPNRRSAKRCSSVLCRSLPCSIACSIPGSMRRSIPYSRVSAPQRSVSSAAYLVVLADRRQLYAPLPVRDADPQSKLLVRPGSSASASHSPNSRTRSASAPARTLYARLMLDRHVHYLHLAAAVAPVDRPDHVTEPPAQSSVPPSRRVAKSGASASIGANQTVRRAHMPR